MVSWHWILIALVFGTLEILTTSLWFLWFGLGALAVAIVSWLGWFTVLQSQLYFFALVTLLLIIFTRPLALKLFKSEDVASNTKALIGRHGIAIEDILPLRYGQVKVSGEIWTAVCQGDQEIKANEPVEIIGIDGVKLLVKKVVM